MGHPYCSGLTVSITCSRQPRRTPSPNVGCGPSDKSASTTCSCSPGVTWNRYWTSTLRTTTGLDPIEASTLRHRARRSGLAVPARSTAATSSAGSSTSTTSPPGALATATRSAGWGLPSTHGSCFGRSNTILPAQPAVALCLLPFTIELASPIQPRRRRRFVSWTLQGAMHMRRSSGLARSWPRAVPSPTLFALLGDLCAQRWGVDRCRRHGATPPSHRTNNRHSACRGIPRGVGSSREQIPQGRGRTEGARSFGHQGRGAGAVAPLGPALAPIEALLTAPPPTTLGGSGDAQNRRRGCLIPAHPRRCPPRCWRQPLPQRFSGQF